MALWKASITLSSALVSQVVSKANLLTHNAALAVQVSLLSYVQAQIEF